MMPAVAADLGIDPKLIGVFTALTYVVAAVGALIAAGPIVRLGAVRICQAALLIGALGLVVNSLATVAATVAAVLLIGATQGPANPAAAHVLAQRTATLEIAWARHHTATQKPRPVTGPKSFEQALPLRAGRVLDQCLEDDRDCHQRILNEPGSGATECCVVTIGLPS